MALSVICSGFFIYFLIVALLGPSGAKSDRLRARIESISNKSKNIVSDDELNKPFKERFLIPVLSRLLTTTSRILPKVSNPRLQKELMLAGINMQAGNYSALRTLSALGGGMVFCLLCLAIGQNSPVSLILFFFFGCALVLCMYRFWLQSVIKKRKLKIRSQLPDMMDLLSVSVEAGLGFDAALLKVTERKKNELSDEMIKVYREIQMGCPRKDALKNLTDRTSLDEIKTFTSSIIQADQLGISLKNVLKAQAHQLRQQRRQRAEEKAMKAPVKIMIPLVLFIFPVMFIILLGPSVLNIINAFKK